MITNYISRKMEEVLKIAVKQFPSVIVTGPRQSGKTTLLKYLFSKSHKYVSMDNPDLRLLADKEPNIFFQSYQPPLIIDEIQYVPSLFSYIKMLIDKNREFKGQFLLTGSQSFPMMSKVTESLAGRIAVFTLLSLSFQEQFTNKDDIDIGEIKNRILSGGFPDIITNKEISNELWWSSYFQTYLERDIRQLRQIGNITDFQRFLQLLANHNGCVLNLSNLSVDLGVAVNTIKAWLSVLEASSQIILVKPFYINKGKRIIKSPKVYFLDTGLLCYLSGISSAAQVFAGHLSGQMLETAALGEIVRCFYNNGRIPRIYWWRTSYGEEVDFVVENKGKLIPIELKLSGNTNREMAKGLFSFSKLFYDKVEKALLINLSKDELLLDKKIISVPFSKFIFRTTVINR